LIEEQLDLGHRRIDPWEKILSSAERKTHDKVNLSHASSVGARQKGVTGGGKK
jgi:hypothetical protein